MKDLMLTNDDDSPVSTELVEVFHLDWSSLCSLRLCDLCVNFRPASLKRRGHRDAENAEMQPKWVLACTAKPRRSCS